MLPTITEECSQFLQESNGFPLLKNLPVDNHGFRKVKVRKKKKQQNVLIEAFNETFNNHSNLMERSIFAHGMNSFIPVCSDEVEPFYIFPINGYKFLFAENVANTTEVYKTTLATLIENYGEKGLKIFKEVLKYQYTFDNLIEGLATNSEIIIYDIPYYYAIRYSLIENYENFITSA
jgi:hypothetical protein